MESFQRVGNISVGSERTAIVVSTYLTETHTFMAYPFRRCRARHRDS
jgi:hypothetical protein